MGLAIKAQRAAVQRFGTRLSAVRHSCQARVAVGGRASIQVVQITTHLVSGSEVASRPIAVARFPARPASEPRMVRAVGCKSLRRSVGLWSRINISSHRDSPCSAGSLRANSVCLWSRRVMALVGPERSKSRRRANERNPSPSSIRSALGRWHGTQP